MEQSPISSPKRDVIIFFILTCAISWGIGGVAVLLSQHRGGIAYDNPIFLILTGAPSLAAISITFYRNGFEGVKQLLSMLFRSFDWRWLVLALCILPLIFFIVLGVSATYRSIGFSGGLSSYIVWLVAIVTTGLLFSNPAAFLEELGWRGFALSNLLLFTTPFRASIIVAIMWIVWHLPAFFFSDAISAGTSGILWWAMSILAITLIMTSLFIHTNKNVFVAGVLPHMFINSSTGIVDTGSIDSFFMLVVASIVFILLMPRRQ